MLGWAPTGRKCALQPAVNERFVRCGADRTLARKKHTAQWFRRSQTLIEFRISVVKRSKILNNSGLLKKRSREIGKMWRILNKVFTPIDL